MDQYGVCGLSGASFGRAKQGCHGLSKKKVIQTQVIRCYRLGDATKIDDAPTFFYCRISSDVGIRQLLMVLHRSNPVS